MQESLIGLHVPWAIGGPAIERDGARSERAPEFPDFPVPTVRLWDTRTTWLNLEPRQDLWDFSNLDAHIEQAHSHGTTDITLVLWGTPMWAASSTSETDAHWIGPGSASMPRDIEDWRDFVTTVATKYKGIISAYEIGNEPNVPTFWRGTDQELAQLVREAAVIIHSIDPQAKVVAPAPVFINARSATTRAASQFWDELSAAQRTISADPGRVDALSFHWYPGPTTKPKQLKALTAQLQERAEAAGFGETPLWLTEVNYYREGLSATEQQSKVTRTNAIIKQLELPRAYWYAWTDLGSLEFMQFGSDTPPGIALANDLSAKD